LTEDGTCLWISSVESVILPRIYTFHMYFLPSRSHTVKASYTNNLSISKISSTCFGQSFVHLQERKTESSSFLHTVHVVPRCRCPKPCLPQQKDTIPYVVKNLSLALLKTGKILREICWADLGDQ